MWLAEVSRTLIRCPIAEFLARLFDVLTLRAIAEFHARLFDDLYFNLDAGAVQYDFVFIEKLVACCLFNFHHKLLWKLENSFVSSAIIYWYDTVFTSVQKIVTATEFQKVGINHIFVINEPQYHYRELYLKNEYKFSIFSFSHSDRSG